METNPEIRVPGSPGRSGRFRTLFGLLLPLTLLTAAGPAPLAVPVLVGGIQINEPLHERWVEAVRGAGLNAVQVTLYARQQAWDGPELYWEAEAPSVVAEIRAARAAGLRTVLVMRVALEHGLEVNRHLWHGMIWPTDAHLAAWMDAYRRFVRFGARMAADEGVDLFVIGNELTSMTSTAPVDALPDLWAYFLDPERVAPVREALTGCAATVRESGSGEDLVQLDGGRYPDLEAMLRAEERVRRQWVRTVTGGDPTDLGPLRARRARLDAYWREVIAEVREIYSGPVTYGANFDQYASVGFWHALDAIAVNAYFPLSRYGLDPADRRARMRRSWTTVARRLEAAADLPVVLLELGWTRRSGATVRPYSYDRVEVLETGAGAAPELSCVHWATQPLDPGERVDAMTALADVVAAGDFPGLRGLMLWKLTTWADQRPIEPFAVVLDGPDDPGARDRELVAQAARIADSLERDAPHPAPSRMAILR